MHRSRSRLYAARGRERWCAAPAKPEAARPCTLPSQRSMLRNRSIICFGGEDWWYHHPHSKAHLMRKFARDGNKVIFVNSISMGLPGLAHKDLLPRIKRKLVSYAKLARQTDDGITVISPASLPFFGAAA